jgi:hypothetical protein
VENKITKDATSLIRAFMTNTVSKNNAENVKGFSKSFYSNELKITHF